MFSKQMLMVTARGFAGRFVTEWVHENGQVVIVGLKVVAEGAMRETGMSGT